MRRLIILATIGALTACSDTHTKTHEKATDHLPAMEQGIVISNAMVRPPFPGRTMTAGYMQIANGGPADRLIAAESDIAERVEIHTHKMEDGIMKMRKVNGVDLPANDHVLFAPGGYHLMMFGITLDENQSDASITLKFKNAPDLTVIAEIADPILDQPIKSESHEGH